MWAKGPNPREPCSKESSVQLHYQFHSLDTGILRYSLKFANGWQLGSPLAHHSVATFSRKHITTFHPPISPMVTGIAHPKISDTSQFLIPLLPIQAINWRQCRSVSGERRMIVTRDCQTIHNQGLMENLWIHWIKSCGKHGAIKLLLFGWSGNN